MAGHTGPGLARVAVRPQLVWFCWGCACWTVGHLRWSCCDLGSVQAPPPGSLWAAAVGFGESPPVPVSLLVIFKSRGARGSPGEHVWPGLRQALQPLGDPPGHTGSPFSRAQGCRRLPGSSERGLHLSFPVGGVGGKLGDWGNRTGRRRACVKGLAPWSWFLLPQEGEAVARE